MDDGSFRMRHFPILSAKQTGVLLVVTVAICISNLVFADSKFVNNARLPNDVKPSCTANIAPWFGGTVTANGWVEPANGLNPIFSDFKNNTRCDFYKWGAQMFLWLTSGKENYHVFNNSPEFYNVSVETNGKRTFLSGDGTIVLGVRKSKTDEEIELGQAGGSEVLISQGESLVYYGIHVNNIYALYTTGKSIKKAAKGLSDHFPSTKDEVQAVSKFAKNYGYQIRDIRPMVIELKTSWVDASTVPDPNEYVISQAVVPEFDRSKPKGPWPVTGNVTKTLALVGMHVVGTVDGHPEMIWSTFEHANNVPDNSYTYTSANDKTESQTYNSSGGWNFIKSNLPRPKSITANGKIDSANSNTSLANSIVNIGDAKIGPVDVFRVAPWGNDQSNSCGAITDNNTDLASINSSVLSQLKGGDIRGNYIQTGGIWTAEGQIPPGFPTTSPTYLRGSLSLSNSTMETYYQFYNNSSSFNPINCFGCHGGVHGATSSNPVSNPTFVSHIFEDMEPLPER